MWYAEKGFKHGNVGLTMLKGTCWACCRTGREGRQESKKLGKAYIADVFEKGPLSHLARAAKEAIVRMLPLLGDAACQRMPALTWRYSRPPRTSARAGGHCEPVCTQTPTDDVALTAGRGLCQTSVGRDGCPGHAACTGARPLNHPCWKATDIRLHDVLLVRSLSWSHPSGASSSQRAAREGRRDTRLAHLARGPSARLAGRCRLPRLTMAESNRHAAQCSPATLDRDPPSSYLGCKAF